MGIILNPKVVEFLKDKEVIEICPELLANMPTPRPSAEIVNGIVMDINGNIVDEEYRHAVQLALNELRSMEIDLVILQSRSLLVQSRIFMTVVLRGN